VALRSTFQCYSQALNSWARSPQAINEPRFLTPYTHADFLWGQAKAHALMADGVDPAWTGVLLHPLNPASLHTPSSALSPLMNGAPSCSTSRSSRDPDPLSPVVAAPCLRRPQAMARPKPRAVRSGRSSSAPLAPLTSPSRHATAAPRATDAATSPRTASPPVLHQLAGRGQVRQDPPRPTDQAPLPTQRPRLQQASPSSPPLRHQPPTSTASPRTMRRRSSHNSMPAMPAPLPVVVALRATRSYGWTGQQSSSGFSDLAPSILHYNWF
jgi:hypothetical protein